MSGGGIAVVLKCKDNIENLKERVEDLKNEKTRVENYKKYVERRGEIIGEVLHTWLISAHELLEQADQFVRDAEETAQNKCFFGLCFNPKSRYNLSIKAIGDSNTISEHVEKAWRFNLPLSYPPARRLEVAAPAKGFEHFPLRTAVLDQIMEALESPIGSMIGVYGISGMEKTMLVNEVKRKAEDNRLFPAVVMTTGVKNRELRSIQDEIARALGMDLLPEALSVREVADRIRARLKLKVKFLVILDDVPDTGIDLEGIGIPSSREEEDMLCKILLISTDPNVLIKMGANDRIFEVPKLKDDEARELLRKIVGNNVERHDLQMVEKCRGLPADSALLGEDITDKTQQPFEAFPSRTAVLDKIMEALRSPIVNMIGVYGIPGVGKTMLVKEVKRRAEESWLFPAVVMATGIKDRNLESIQDEIVRDLGMDLLSKELSVREVADGIKSGLKQKKKFLVILDDIPQTGTDLLLEEIGIPSASELMQSTERKTLPVPSHLDVLSSIKNEASSSIEEEEDMKWKILLTARDRSVVCSMMGEKDLIFKVPQLEADEALELFRKFTGNNVESSNFQRLAEDIVGKCLGLPVAIASVGRAMKGKTKENDWKTALRELRRPNPEGLSAAVYKPIELCYNYLQDEEHKRTFILCSLLGQDSSVEELLKYGMGLELFDKVNTIEETRGKILTLVDDLKLSSLLVDGRSTLHFDMHDQIREVALFIASRDRGVFALMDEDARIMDEDARKSWPEDGTKLKWIYLSNGDKLPVKRLESPQLTFFHLSNKGRSISIPRELFAETDGVKVLCLTKIEFESMASLPLIPTSVNTLVLDQCVFKEKNIGGIIENLGNLEVLSLVDCDIEELPREIGKLAELKVLDLTDCRTLQVIPQQVLASLSRLEELKMGHWFDKWRIEVCGKQRNASLAELTQLPNLTALEVRINDFQRIPNGLFSEKFLEKLRRFKILIGDGWYDWNSLFESTRILKLSLKGSISFDRSVRRLLRMTEELHVRELNCVKNVVDELDGEGFQDLKYLYVDNAPKVQQIVNSGEQGLFSAFPSLEVLSLRCFINLEKLFQGRFNDTAFSKLRKITVFDCDKLKNLFSCSIARQLLQLQEIEVISCKNMTEIVDDKETGNENEIVEASEVVKLGFGKLVRSLKLHGMPSLKSFNSSYCSSMTLFNEQVVFPNLEELYLSGIDVNSIWQASITSSSVEKLTKLEIQDCDNLKYLFSLSMATCLVKLRHLEIRYCKSMRGIIVTENREEKDNLIFPQLNFLMILHLENLVGFYLGNCNIEFPSLKQLVVTSCPEFKGFTIKSTSTDVATDIQSLFNEQVVFPKLEQVTIERVVFLNKMWHNQLDAESLCQLTSVKVVGCKKLLNIFPHSMLERRQRLEKLEIVDCDSLEEIFESQGFGISPSQAHITIQPSLESTDFEFTKLTRLVLCGLPNFKGFSSQMHITKWPSLKHLEVRGCDQFQIFASELPNFRTTNGNDQIEIQIKCSLFWISKDSFPSLEEVVLGGNNMKEIWRGQYPGEYFPKLKYIKLDRFKGLSTLCPFFFQSLPSLERLTVFERRPVLEASFDEIFQCERLADAPSRLSELMLSNLNEVTHLWKEESDLEPIFFNLRTLTVQKCSKLINLVPSIVSFQNLQSLNVSSCHGLENLVEYSTAKSLTQLTRMSITNCKVIQEIIACLEDDVKSGIVFSKLYYLVLRYLPGLTSFCSMKCKFEFPSLKYVEVIDCPNMETFSKGETSTPKLQEVYGEVGQGFWEGDLNSTIQFMHKTPNISKERRRCRWFEEDFEHGNFYDSEA